MYALSQLKLAAYFEAQKKLKKITLALDYSKQHTRKDLQLLPLVLHGSFILSCLCEKKPSRPYEAVVPSLS